MGVMAVGYHPVPSGGLVLTRSWRSKTRSAGGTLFQLSFLEPGTKNALQEETPQLKQQLPISTGPGTQGCKVRACPAMKVPCSRLTTADSEAGGMMPTEVS